MRLATLKAFRSLVYAPGSAPSARTLRKRIDAGHISGGRIEAGRYYVDLDEYDRHTSLRAGVAARLAELEKSPRLKDLL